MSMEMEIAPTRPAADSQGGAITSSNRDLLDAPPTVPADDAAPYDVRQETEADADPLQERIRSIR